MVRLPLFEQPPVVYDDVVVGSGLTGLATALGLPASRRVLVVAGPAIKETNYYGGTTRIPCSNLGLGGLGSFWHGVIPVLRPPDSVQGGNAVLEELFKCFYPAESVAERIGDPWLFVPYSPIRPAVFWRRLSQERGERLAVVPGRARALRRESDGWTVAVDDRDVRARRVWLAAGALGTPALLEQSEGLSGAARETASDHVILYLGQLDRRAHPSVPLPVTERGRSGFWVRARLVSGGDGLVTTKPARFDYARLDHGIEQRAAFGLPVSGVIGKLARARSLGLISESVFNKFGLFPRAGRLSVYAQVRVEDAYRVSPGSSTVVPIPEALQRRIQQFRDELDWPELTKSRRGELFIPGIHLHRTLDSARLRALGVDEDQSGLSIVDPSTMDDVGSEHHTFRAMVSAYDRARRAGAA